MSLRSISEVLLMQNHRLVILNYIRDELKKLRTHADIPVTRIWRRTVDPVKVAEEHLPSIFYGYGGFFLNNLTVGSNYQGETMSLAVNAVINQVYKEDAPDILAEEGDLVSRTAKLHTAMANIVSRMKTVVDDETCKPISPTMNFRLSSGEPQFQGLSDREFIIFIIEVDWFYKRESTIPSPKTKPMM